MLQKCKNLKNGPNFDRLEPTPKINMLQKNSHIVFFWVLEHFYARGTQLYKNILSGLFWPPYYGGLRAKPPAAKQFS